MKSEHDTFDRLQRVFRETLDRDRMRITLETTQQHTPEWDSMAQVNLIMSIEQEFDVQFTSREIGELTSVAAIVRLLDQKLGATQAG